MAFPLSHAAFLSLDQIVLFFFLLSLCGSKDPWDRLLMCSQALFGWSFRNSAHLCFLKHWGVSKDVGVAPTSLNWTVRAAPQVGFSVPGESAVTLLVGYSKF